MAENNYDKSTKDFFKSKTFKTVLIIFGIVIGVACLVTVCGILIMLLGIGNIFTSFF